MAAEDPLRLMEDLDAAWNAHDEEGVLDLFTEDAVARVVPLFPRTRRLTKAKIG